MPNEFVARNGIIALNNSIITGSLNVTQGVTASLFGTSSWATNALSSSYILSAVSASFASTASNVLGGAANYIPLFNTATTLSSSVMYQSSGNVGIGTTSPTQKLHVVGNMVLDAGTTGYIFGASGEILIGEDTTGLYIGQGNGVAPSIPFYYGTTNTTSHGWYAGSSTARMFLSSSGRVGIGTTSPSSRLFINTGGVGATSNGIGMDNGAQQHFWYLSDNTTSTFEIGSVNGVFKWANSNGELVRITSAGVVGIGTTAPSGLFEVKGEGVSYFTRGTKSILLNPNVVGADTNALIDVTSGMGLAFATGNSEHMRITSGGNVGIGTTTPYSKFTTYGSMSTSTSQISIVNSEGGHAIIRSGISGISNNGISFVTANVDGTSQNVRAVISATGDVGIGTTSPNAKLDVNGNAIITGSLTVTSTITAQTLVVQTITSSVDFVTGSTRFGSLLSNTHQFTGSVGMTGSLTVNNNVLSVGGTNVGIGTTNPQAKLHVDAGDVYVGDEANVIRNLIFRRNAATVGSIGTYNSQLELNGGSSLGAGHLVITSAGNVGIGTTSPGAKLEVSGTIRNVTFSNSFTNSYTAAFGNTRIIGSSNPQLELWHDGNSVGQFSFASSILNYGIHTGAGTQTTYLTISNTGNVGIGITSPSYKLDVSGSFRAYYDSATYLTLDSSNVSLAANGTITIGDSSTDAINIGTATTENRPTTLKGSPINLQTNGATRLFISQSGNTGIGTLTPTALLQVSGSTTTNLLVGNSDLFVSASGNVGIGTTSPSYKLSVAGAVYTTGNILVDRTTGNNTNIQLNSGTPYIQFGTNGTTHYIFGGSNIPLGFSTNEIERMRITGDGNVGIGTSTPNSLLNVNGADPFVRINNSSTNNHGIKISYNNLDTHGLHLIYNANVATASIDNTFPATSGQVYGDIHFRQNVGGSMTTRMMIKADGGNVGIGTTSPSYKLVISNNGASGLEIDTTGGINSGPFIQAYNRSTSNYMHLTTYALSHTTYVASTRVVDITTAGNVGIGTTSPNAKLDVNGNTIITGSLTVITGSSIELQVLNTGVRIGSIVTDTHTVTGSLNVSGSITGSLFGTASFAVSASWAPSDGGTVSEPIPAGAKLYLFYNY